MILVGQMLRQVQVHQETMKDTGDLQDQPSPESWMTQNVVSSSTAKTGSSSSSRAWSRNAVVPADSGPPLRWHETRVEVASSCIRPVRSCSSTKLTCYQCYFRNPEYQIAPSLVENPDFEFCQKFLSSDMWQNNLAESHKLARMD